MARITVEDCLEKIPNLFDLVLTASKRARRLANGAESMVEWENDKPTVVALREIAAGHVTIEILEENEQQQALEAVFEEDAPTQPQQPTYAQPIPPSYIQSTPALAPMPKPEVAVAKPEPEAPQSFFQPVQAPVKPVEAEQPAAAEPEAVAPEPEAVAAEPEAVAAEPEAVAAQPEAVAAEPEAVAAEPEAVAAEPESSDSASDDGENQTIPPSKTPQE